jgi:hypothetical protein
LTAVAESEISPRSLELSYADFGEMRQAAWRRVSIVPDEQVL